MDTRYPTMAGPATAEYVLEVLRDDHRQQCRCGPPVDPDISLSFDTTIADWREACVLVGWRKLGKAMNEAFGIHCPDQTWYDVLEPAEEKRLDGVCELIAKRSQRPRIRPARLFGCTSSAAGAFLTIRSLLHEAGASAGEITPSTELAEYTRRYCEVFLGPVSRLAPGALPALSYRRHPLHNAALSCAGVGLICTLAGAFCQWIPVAISGGVAVVIGVAGTWMAAGHLPLKRLSFGELRTFRDLARVVAAGNASPA